MVTFRLTGDPLLDEYIDSVCEIYRQDLQAGRNPSIDPWLNGLPPRAQVVLRRELLALAKTYKALHDWDSGPREFATPGSSCVAMTYDSPK